MKKNNIRTKILLFRSNFKSSKSWIITSYIFLGIVSTIWFIFRVITKPSRVTYPCMRAAAPFMSGFIIYILTISASVIAFKKFRNKLNSAKYFAAGAFLVVAFFMILLSNTSIQKEVSASGMMPANHLIANDPIGVASGLKPGRVVWVWDEDATDKNLVPENNKNGWWANYTNKDVVEAMLKKSILAYTDMTSVPQAWDALFKYFNEQHGKGSIGYKPGEKIYIKLNITNSASSVKKTTDFNHIDSTPELALSLLKELIEVVGVAQKDIYIGDPFRRFHDLYWDMCHSVYPEVVYCDNRGTDGRHQTLPSTEHVMVFSDKMHEYRIPQEYIDASYIINMPCLKTHNEGGITLGAKNHQGSVIQDDVSSADQYMISMHYSLPANNPGYKKYRHTVDYLGHKDTGGKTLMTIIDGIWAGRSWEGFIEKWNMTPFNGDYPSSLFLSQDRVAIDAVCYDFLLEEYKNKSSNQKYPYIDGCDDYLLQAADPSYWPEGLEYDPEGDGIPIGSLGVYEHWNNATDKKYSRNLGTGNGIELVTISKNDIVSVTDLYSTPNEVDVKIYPNPAKDNILIQYYLSESCQVSAEIFDVAGKKVAGLFNKNENKGNSNFQWNVKDLKSGNYYLQIKVNTKEEQSVSSVKFIVAK